MTVLREWKGVPEDSVKQWMRSFLSKETRDVSGACPICNAHTLHQWFDRPRLFAEGKERPGFIGHGGGWQWCSSCYSYEHYSGLVPDWWRDTLKVDTEKLTHSPEAIEVARLRAIADSTSIQS